MARNKKKNANKRRAKQRRKQRHNNGAHGGESIDSMSDDDSMDSILLHLGITSAAMFTRQNTVVDSVDGAEDAPPPSFSRLNSVQPRPPPPPSSKAKGALKKSASADKFNCNYLFNHIINSNT